MNYHKPPEGHFAPFANIGEAWAPPPVAKPPNGGDLPRLCAASLAGRSAPTRKFVVADLIPDRTVTMLTGDGGVGKSTLIQQLAVSVSMGALWLGLEVERGPVVFVTAEDDADELHRRLEAIAEAERLDIAALGDLHFIPLAGQDAVMGAPDKKSGMIRETGIWRRLREIVDDVKPRLVILDTLADIFAGNEIARTEARQFIGMLRGLAIDSGVAVVLLAHPSLSGMSNGTGTSGSTGWSNSVRSRLYFERVLGDDGREISPDLRVLRTMKANYGPTGGEIRLRYSHGVFVREATGSPSLASMLADASAERVFLELLGKLAAQGRDVSAKPSQSYAPSVFEKHPGANGIRKRAFTSAMERLLEAGRISVEAIGPASRRVSRLVIVNSEVE